MATQVIFRRALAPAVALALMAAACNSTPKSQPVVGGLLGFDQITAKLDNGTLPDVMPALVCGSDTATFGTELLNTAPQDARVTDEWGEIVPGAKMQVAGTITDFTFSMGDLPFTHPFNKDVTFDIKLQKPYQPLEKMLGTPDATESSGGLHWEISQGLVPHQDTEAYLPGFVPANGDSVASVGHWIIDCGHPNYQTELHPPTMVAFAHAEGSTAVSHAFYNPYFETQLYNPDPSLANALGDNARFNDPNTLTFPQYLVQEILRAGHAGPSGPLCCHDQLETHMLLLANRTSPPPWYVCAPGPKGSKLSVSSHFTVRDGVTLTVTPDDDTGCVQFSATIGPRYQPMIPDRKDCPLPWSELDAQAQAATGNPNLKVKDAIDKLVPASFLPNVNKPPVVDCYDPLVVPAPRFSAAITRSNTQPFPFYGTATVAWQK